MDKLRKEKIKLTVKEILLTLYNGIDKIEAIFGYPSQRIKALERIRERQYNKEDYCHALWRLEKQGYIKKYQTSKKTIIRLTKIGKEKANKYILEDYKIKISKKWDKKWRIIIFDIPEDKKNLRNILRNKLNYWGFFQLQKSVFVFPYDCQKEIAALKFIYNLAPYIQYIVAESIESEVNLVDYFYENDLIKGR